MFEWDVKEPFNVSLVSGEIKANSSIDVTFNFKPTVNNFSFDSNCSI